MKKDIIKIFSLLVSLLFTNTFFAQKPKVDTLKYIIEKHTEAMGGKKNLEAIKSVTRIRGSGNMVVISQMKPTLGIAVMLFDTTKWRLRYAEGSNQQYHWEQLGEDSIRKIVTGRPDSAMRNTMMMLTNLFLPLFKTKEKGNKVEYLGRKTIDSIQYYEVQLTLSTGKTTLFYVNPNSFLIERNRGVRRLHAFEENVREIETVFKDFRKINGIPVSHIEIERDINTGEVLSGGKPSMKVEFNLVFNPKDMQLEGNAEKWKQYLKDFLGRK